MGAEFIANLPPAPDDVVEWIRKRVVNQGYMFYSKKEDRACCSRCGATMGLGWFEGADIYSGRNSECPMCGAKGIFRPDGIGRKKLTDHFRVMICVPDGKDAVVTVSEVDAVFEKPGPPEIYRLIRQVHRYSETGCENWFYHIGYYDCFKGYIDGWWEQKKTTFLYTPGRFGWCGNVYDMIHVYDGNIRGIEIDLFRYAGIAEYYEQHELTASELIKYMAMCLKYPQIEKLRKFGCDRLILNYINDYGPKNAVNWKGKTIQKMLRCNMAEAKEIRDHEADLRTLLEWQKFRKRSFRLTIDAVELWLQKEGMYFRTTDEDAALTPKAAQYLADQNRKYKKHNMLRDYLDYYRDCRTLHYDWSRKRNQFPADFAKTHQELAKKVAERTKAIDEARYQKAVQILHETAAGRYEEGDFCIIIPATGEEIREEGRQQCHCVGGYVAKVERKECFIVFLRKKEEPDKPFYTVELSKDLKIMQCRGFKNCSKTPEVEVFVQHWTAAMEAEKKKQKRKLKKAV